MYFWVREDWLLDDTVIGTPDVGYREINFISGSPIDKTLTTPIVFETSYTAGAQPHHYFDYGTRIPAVHATFVEALRGASVDNFEVFPACLKSTEDGTVWQDYFALNVIGLVNATDLDNSICEEIMGGNDEGMPALGVFEAIALYKDKLLPFDMFREPIGGNLLMSERALEAVAQYYPEGGLGIIAEEVTLT